MFSIVSEQLEHLMQHLYCLLKSTWPVPTPSKIHSLAMALMHSWINRCNANLVACQIPINKAEILNKAIQTSNNFENNIRPKNTYVNIDDSFNFISIQI